MVINVSSLPLVYTFIEYIVTRSSAISDIRAIVLDRLGWVSLPRETDTDHTGSGGHELDILLCQLHRVRAVSHRTRCMRWSCMYIGQSNSRDCSC